MTSGAGQGQATAAQGLFGMQGLMDDFYGYQPDGDDDEGRALKRGFQADMINKFANSQLAMAQATVLERDLVAELERRRQDSATITRLISEMDRINEMAGQAVRDPASTTNTGLVNILAKIDQVQSNSASIMERIDADDREAEARMGINWDSNLPLPSYEDLYGEPDK